MLALQIKLKNWRQVD